MSHRESFREDIYKKYVLCKKEDIRLNLLYMNVI